MRERVWRLLRWFLFRLDAETAHHLTVAMIRVGIRLRSAPLRWISSGGSSRAESAPARVFGMEFRSRVGLAAGFDKNCDLLEALPALGFGFAEIGTVTPRPQPGNDRPRLFRQSAEGALFNRMGFNNLGAALVAERLRATRDRLPAAFRVGVNIGKNKDTPVQDAAQDYASAVGPFEGLADYLVINVSSPNTPGLRSLQTVEALKPIVEGVQKIISGWKIAPPLLLKLAPELEGEDLGDILRSGEGWGVSGWVLTNTLGGTFRAAAGGWSGSPLTLRSRRSLIEARQSTRLPIISVGGIMTSDEAIERRRSGAELVQIYTGWVYGGPGFPSEIASKLAEKGP